ncbi:amidohydrolase family protein [Intestinimonas massiliensis (ex Afouda et al. 2020)]|uniref:amidohydrolase family protein n=1 Tax=Intestinimonas massiliensis (ex Afouda et al. 2020) TaxID=1673721 RepID=UPI00103278B6|nr:amidohydrolase family protein [Intestinimonas massiliensis (ex Afouda et al. 2020)]
MLGKHPTRLIPLTLSMALLLGTAPAFAVGTPVQTAADIVYRDANIYTVDDDNPTATALAIKGDRIVYVGGEEGVEAYIGEDTKVTDLNGLTVLPGIMEGHMHMSSMGKTLIQLNVFWKPKNVILEAVRAAAQEAEPGEWIQGQGWMNTIWEDTDFPTKEELDAVAPDNPVYLKRADGHMAWVNSMALELAGVTKDTPNPQGGEILKTEDGEVLGCVTDNARDFFTNIIPAYSTEEQREIYLLAQNELFTYGITSAMDAGCDVTDIENYQYLYETGQMKLRTYPLVRLLDTTNAQADYVRENLPAGMMYDNRMNLRAVKITTDGSLGARSAAMLEEYSDREGYCGELRFTDEQAYEVFKLAYDQGYQICTHTIGDAACRQVLDTLERLQSENPQEDHRLRIEHFQIVAPEDIDRAIQMGVIPSMEFIHATSDMLVAEDRIGAERMKGAYAWRTVLDKGSIIVGGTDAPVELVNPWHNFYAGVTRKNRDGVPENGWYAEQAVTREEVLKSYTIWVAYGQFEEDIKGSLEVGKLADFVVIDRDIMTCPEDEMKDVQALMTVIGGEVVYTKDTAVPTIMWHGVPLTFNSALIEEPGKIYAPVADVMNGIGGTVEKNGEFVTVTYNGVSATLPVTSVSGTDYVGLRALFEGLNQSVVWCQTSRTVSTSTVL